MSENDKKIKELIKQINKLTADLKAANLLIVSQEKVLESQSDMIKKLR